MRLIGGHTLGSAGQDLCRVVEWCDRLLEFGDARVEAGEDGCIKDDGQEPCVGECTYRSSIGIFDGSCAGSAQAVVVSPPGSNVSHMVY